MGQSAYCQVSDNNSNENISDIFGRASYEVLPARILHRAVHPGHKHSGGYPKQP